MSHALRWKLFAALGGGSFTLSLYTMWKTWLYFHGSGDTTGSAIFGCVSFCLLTVAGLHWYMAVGFKFGRIDSVTGSIALARLKRGNSVVINAARIQFVRKLDADDSNLTANNRYVFFICGYRPWVCKEAQFQVV